MGFRQFYDVVVVGGGVAGLSASVELARYPISVLLIERKRRIGYPVVCGEYIPALTLKYIDVSVKYLVQEVGSVSANFFNEKVSRRTYRGYTIERRKLENALALKAMEMGVKILTSSIFRWFEKDTVIFEKSGKMHRVRAKFVVGADGPFSTAGKIAGIVNSEFLYGVQLKLPMAFACTEAQICFWRKLKGGYGWFFPKGDVANIGAGMRCRGRKIDISEVKKATVDFVENLRREGYLAGEPIEIIRGYIPCGGFLNPVSVSNRIVLAGDSAGQVHPVTGSGIAQAIYCGKLAGRSVAEAVVKDEVRRILFYKNEVFNYFGSWIDRTLKKRKQMDSRWDKLTGHELEKLWI